ncbi:MAG: hypothetical protein MH208_18970 [Marinobacter sp.]|nr:hypothetical protein [Marinobacter sp.]
MPIFMGVITTDVSHAFAFQVRRRFYIDITSDRDTHAEKSAVEVLIRRIDCGAPLRDRQNSMYAFRNRSSWQYRRRTVAPDPSATASCGKHHFHRAEMRTEVPYSFLQQVTDGYHLGVTGGAGTVGRHGQCGGQFNILSAVGKKWGCTQNTDEQTFCESCCFYH